MVLADVDPLDYTVGEAAVLLRIPMGSAYDAVAGRGADRGR